ncbi:MAG TPA: aminopeptidase P family N-terminal domain-containing protein [bacterium]|nr:aminopeptidase P family N-terminal domain-containing protein [bacterium]
MLPFDPERFARLVRAQRVDVVLASTRHNVRYLTGGDYLPFFARASFGGGRYLSFVAIPSGRLETAFYIGRQDRMLDEQDYIEAFGPIWIANRHWVPRGPSMSSDAATVAARALRDQGLAAATIAIESSSLPPDAYEALRRELPEASFVDGTPLLGELRAIKQPHELARLREVHRFTAEVVRLVFLQSLATETTRQVAAGVERRVGERGAAFLYSLVNVGPGCCARRRPRRGGAVVRCTWTLAPSWMNTSPTSRGWVRWGKPPAAASALFEVCLAAQERARTTLGTGVTCGELWRVGSEAIRVGPGAEYGRFLAHGLGMVSPRSDPGERARARGRDGRFNRDRGAAPRCRACQNRGQCGCDRDWMRGPRRRRSRVVRRRAGGLRSATGWRWEASSLRSPALDGVWERRSPSDCSPKVRGTSAGR